ncbi:MAG: magnesium transporter [Phycisphaerae bacterium]|nr:magnesium transporter [Phycisphaerae bacterium]
MGKERKKLLELIEPLLEAKDIESLKTLLAEQRSSDIAEIVEMLDHEQHRQIFGALDKPTAAEVLEKVDEATRAELFEELPADELEKIVSELDLDDAADLLAELHDEKRDELLKAIDPADSAKIKKLMSYPEDTAGGIMDPALIIVRQDATVAEAIAKIRAAEIEEDFYSVYIVNNTGQLVGDVRIRFLLTAREDMIISDLMDEDTICVKTDADQEEVRNIFSKNDLISVPVVDKYYRLVGRITADRVIEVAEEEAAEDMYVMAGTGPEELDTFSAFRAARIRMTWLIPCLIGTAVTASVLTYFKHHQNAVYVIAAAFVPMIAAMSGNAGLQTSTIVVTGLATGHLAALHFWQVFAREFRIALLIALSCGTLGGLAVSLLAATSPEIAVINVIFAFALAMFSAIMVATTLGLILPFSFRKIGIDPAISSGPLVTTANDSISVTIYMILTLILMPS